MRDQDLVRRALRGKEGFEGLITRYQAEVHGTVFQMLRNRADAEDVVQEVFVRAYRRLSREGYLVVNSTEGAEDLSGFTAVLLCSGPEDLQSPEPVPNIQVIYPTSRP